MVFTQQSDSVFINIMEPLDSNGLVLRDRFITTIRVIQDRMDFAISVAGFYDLNNDGFKEVLFYVNGRFSLQPRQIYSYDIKNDALTSSPKAGSILHGSTNKIMDIDGDGFAEIISNCNAYDNIPDTMQIPYKDQSSWLVVFDHTLNYKFPPVEFRGKRSTLGAYPILTNGKYNILVLFMNRGVDGQKSKLCLFNNTGTLLKERIITDEEISNKISLHNINIDNEIEFYLQDHKGNFEFLNKDLSTKKKISINKSYLNRFSSKDFDLDLDGKDELLFWDYDLGQLLIMRNNFKDIVTMTFPVGNIKFNSVSLKIRPGQNPQLCLQMNDRWYLIDYEFNNLYYLRFPIYLSVYLLVLLFVFLIRKTQKIQIEKKYKVERQIMELQLQSLQKQVDPHFTFNALNSINSLIYKEDKEKAFQFISNFSGLIRRSLLNSDKIATTLNEEINFTKDYLEMQKLLLKDKLEYNFEVDEKVNLNILVPKMCIHTYVENAIKHGLRDKKDKGIIIIGIQKTDSRIEIKVSDNGMGRGKAQKSSAKSTGKGLKIINTIYDLYYQLYKVKVVSKINDLYSNDGTPAGTEVTIEIPVKIKK